MCRFTDAKQLIVVVENRLLGSREIAQPISWFRKEFIHPVFYVFLGMDFLMVNFAKTAIYAGLFAFLAGYISPQFGASSEEVKIHLIIAMMGAVFIVLFALPSTFSSYGIKDSDIAFLAKYIQEKVSSKDELDTLRDNLEVMEGCAANRVATLRWAMATIWGVILFGFSQSIGLLAKLAEKEEVGQIIGGSVTFFITALSLTLLPLVAIAGYRRANHIVFSGLRFACNEVAQGFLAPPKIEECA